ncbi:hypothetical protein [Synechococcus sp. BIOS-E4-1]|uniref:hypothetical protein n=1 Tax=Synechococcus sp. BIOS-E4-1 TaxID=1400864 RepID=UPI001648E9A8|nr:hypothetical protein [Synechococcus sp. BIOS-E4-1]
MNPDSQNAMANAHTLRMVDYNQNSEVQALAASILSELIKKFAAKILVHLAPNEILNVCEYGCATGGSSIAPIRAIEELAGQRKVVIIMNDLPMNDWKTLETTIEAKFPRIDFKYLAKTMYSPIAEEASIHLGYSCFAQHWLDNGAPTGLPGDALWANQLPMNCLERQSWEKASRDNWKNKLLLRANEIVPGGRLIIHIHSSLNCGNLSEKFAETLRKAKSQMITNKELSPEQAIDLLIPQYCKSPAEIFNILCTPEMSSLWQMEEAHHQQLPCDELFEQSNIQKQIGFLKGFLDSTLRTSLNQLQINRFWDHVSQLASNDPNALTSNGMSTFISLKRVG